jgi:predicted nuclease with RNAse H fold
MWKDPILDELYKIRAGLVKEYGGLKGLHEHALKVQDELRAQGVPIVNLHKASGVRKASVVPRAKRKAAG